MYDTSQVACTVSLWGPGAWHVEMGHAEVRLAYLFEVFKHERGTAQQSNSNQA